jgi:hypothetical protein
MAADSLSTAWEIAKLLDTGLDKETLSICIALVENGVNPEVRHPCKSAPGVRPAPKFAARTFAACRRRWQR